ncbi:MAG TPA: hypothetical protein VMW47_11075 [Verrucomicrobiae bacterium]|nr:hypothetical protein [Verrucomicrobiae bacterium]
MARHPKPPPTRRQEEVWWTAVGGVIAFGWGVGDGVLWVAGGDPRRTPGGALRAIGVAIGAAIRGQRGGDLVTWLWNPARSPSRPLLVVALVALVVTLLALGTLGRRLRRVVRRRRSVSGWGGAASPADAGGGSGPSLDQWLARVQSQDEA